MPNVLFLRAPSEAPDRYESTFSGAGYRSSSVPVLETVVVNLEALTNTVRSTPQYGGVIVTSGRAAEVWARVVDALEDEQSIQESDSRWSSTPFYVVGKSTASSLKAIQILEIIAAVQLKPFLYLTGDKNRDALPQILRGGDVELTPLQVYRTQGSSTFPDDLKLALESLSHQHADIWWIVFFAPSAAEFVTPFLRPARVASIGPTTSAFLQDKLNMAVHAVALKPAAENLLEAIRLTTGSR
ncbi:tetrapyrrole biosynthesis, uroporphyrinogen III synthase, partial [Mycena galopus ATCC 62051]